MSSTSSDAGTSSAAAPPTAQLAPGGRTVAGIAYDDEGSGEPIVLVHAGVADRRMWSGLAAELAREHRVIRHDTRGAGETLPPTGPWAHHTDLLHLLDELLVGRAHVIGASMGAGIAVEAALARPEAVASLVLAAPGGALFGSAPASLRSLWAAEVAALDRGDLDGAVEVNLRGWVDGPHRRPEVVDAEVRRWVGEMQRGAFELPEWDPEAVPEHELDPPAVERLHELRCPVLVVVGAGDDPAVLETAERIANAAPRARLVVWPDVAHMLTLERPAEFAALVRDFLRAVGDGRFDGTPEAAPASSGTPAEPGATTPGDAAS
jgi:3-oxoadipate enol-lactonase